MRWKKISRMVLGAGTGRHPALAYCIAVSSAGPLKLSPRVRVFIDWASKIFVLQKL